MLCQNMIHRTMLLRALQTLLAHHLTWVFILVSYSNVKQSLTSCEGSNQFILKDLSLGPKNLHPLFRALMCTYALKEIIIPGNKMGDTGIQVKKKL